MRKAIFLVAAMLIFTTILAFAEEIRLTTIMPAFTRTKYLAIGDTYSTDLTTYPDTLFTATNTDLIVEGNVGIGTKAPTSAASPANNASTGNLEVNDIYLSSIKKWASQLGGHGLPKTGQTFSYTPYDDGYYQSGAPATGARFTLDSSNQTITDNATGLMWANPVMAGVDGMYSWSDAINACHNLDYAGHKDWRLPNINELLSLVDYQNACFFNGFWSVSYYPWSSTAIYNNSGGVWSITPNRGTTIQVDKTYNGYRVFPVRGP